MGGAAALLTGRWCGEAGIESPNRGTFCADFCAPGMGGRRRGAGDAMSERSSGSTLSFEVSATVKGGYGHEAVKEGRRKLRLPRQPATCAFSEG